MDKHHLKLKQQQDYLKLKLKSRACLKKIKGADYIQFEDNKK